MSIVEETINKFVRDSINYIVDINNYSIAAKQNAPRPVTSYASVDIMLIKQIGWEESTFVDRTADVDIDETVEGSREIMCSLQFYRDDAIDNASKVRIGLLRNSIQEQFRASDLGLVSRSDVRDISEPLENGWEKRAQLDIVLSATGTDNDIVRSIQTLTIVGDFQTRDKQVPINIEV